MVYGQGGKYKDNEDADAPELSAELKNVTIDVTFEDNEYRLENNFVKIMEFDNPIVMPVVSTIPAFNFTRSQTGFEDVNTYYHINVYKQYLQSLGFSLVQSQVEVDTHGKNGDDQSLHIFTGSTHRLIFGSGHTVNKHHVDDAEDADVIVHEYGHAISASACSNCNTGTERTSIDEGSTPPTARAEPIDPTPGTYPAPMTHPTTTTPATTSARKPADPTARIVKLLTALDRSLVESGEHVRVAVLALLAGHHVLLLGPPGTAKSLLARALCTCIRGGELFEYLLSKFTHSDELFGPVSIPGLKEEDYRRLTPPTSRALTSPSSTRSSRPTAPSSTACSP